MVVDGRPVIAIAPTTKLKAGMPIPSQFQASSGSRAGPATLTDLPQIPQAGPRLIDALFALKPGEVTSQPDLPERPTTRWPWTTATRSATRP